MPKPICFFESKTEPVVEYIVLINHSGMFYKEYVTVGNTYELTFTNRITEACCFDSKESATKWKKQNKTYIEKSKQMLTPKILHITKSINYVIK